MKSQMIMEEIFPTYVTYKNLEAKLKALKEQMQLLMSEDEKRREFPLCDVVAKYTRNNKYEIDKEGIRELLNSYGLLVRTSIIDTKDDEVLLSVERFKEEQTYHIRINAKVNIEKFDFSNFTIEEVAKEWVETSDKFKDAEKTIKFAKKQMMECEELLKNKKIAFDGGSITLCKNKTTYKMEEIFNEFGLEFFMKHTSVAMSKVDEFIENGMIEYKEVNKFKKLIDVGLKFVMIKMSDEELVYNVLNDKNLNASLNRMIS